MYALRPHIMDVLYIQATYIILHMYLVTSMQRVLGSTRYLVSYIVGRFNVSTM